MAMVAIVAVTAAGAQDASRLEPLVSFSSLPYLLKILILTYYCYGCLITLPICLLYYLFIYLVVTAT